MTATVEPPPDPSCCRRCRRLRAALRQLGRQPRVWVGGGILLAVLLLAVFAPWIAPHDPLEQDLLHMLAPPMWAPDGDATYPLGHRRPRPLRAVARDLRRAGCADRGHRLRRSGSMLLGSTLALLGGYFGGVVDRVISYVVDLWMSFPPVVLSLILLVGLGTGVDKVILAVVLVDWTRFCRVVRADVLVTRRRDYVLAAQLMGFSHLRTMLREVLPAVVPLMITLFSIEMGIAIVVEATLSFIGLSVPPEITTWGQMLADARNDMQSAVWVHAGAGSLHHRHRAGLQPLRRRRPRGTRSAAAPTVGMSMLSHRQSHPDRTDIGGTAGRPVARRLASLERGKVLGLVGESGAGKSMIGRMIAGHTPAGFEVTRGDVAVRRPGPAGAEPQDAGASCWDGASPSSRRSR